MYTNRAFSVITWQYVLLLLVSGENAHLCSMPSRFGTVSVSADQFGEVSVRSLTFNSHPSVLQSVVHCRNIEQSCDIQSCYCPCVEPLVNADGSYVDWISSSILQCNSTVLVLGLGLGELIANMAARCERPLQAVALEADSTVLDLAGRFGYKEGVRVILDTNGTSQALLELYRTGASFDVIVVDCFVGRIVPVDCRSEEFVRNLRSLSNSVVHNVYQEDSNEQVSDYYRRHWPHVSRYQLQDNTLILAASDSRFSSLTTVSFVALPMKLAVCTLLGLTLCFMMRTRISGNINHYYGTRLK